MPARTHAFRLRAAVLSIGAAAGTAVVQAQATPAASAVADIAPVVDADYARPHQRLDIGGGRRLNLFCSGSGTATATVIFEGGTGEAAWEWLAVHPAVARVTRACVYDRAGYGFSDAPARPGTAANAVDDLHALLAAAHIGAPLVLVGHSYGGQVAQLYAYTYPREVGGLVLVDTDHEDAASRGDKATGGKLAPLKAQMTAYFEGCRGAARTGLREGTEAFENCVGDAAERARWGTALWPAVEASRTRLATYDTIASERDNEDGASASALRAARRPFGDLPLVYLTRGVSPYATPGQPQSAGNKAFEDDVLKSHDEIVALSTRGVDYVVPGSGHDIHVEKPQAVIDAVLAVVAQQGR